MGLLLRIGVSVGMKRVLVQNGCMGDWRLGRLLLLPMRMVV